MPTSKAVLFSFTTLAVAVGFGVGWAASRSRRVEPTAPQPAAAEPAAATTSAPRLQVVENPVPFGAHFDDEAPQVVVRLRSVGRTALHVESVEPGCGCIAVDEARTALVPGAETSVRLKVKLAGMSGSVSRHVVVHSDDPASPLTRVVISGEVKPRIEATPPFVALRPATIDASATVDLDVRSGAGEPLEKLTAVSTAPGVTATVSLAGGAATVHVVAKPTADDVHGTLVLRLGAYERILALNVIAAVDVRVVPDRLFVTAGRTPTEAQFVARDGVSWRVKSVETDRKDLLAEVAEGSLRVRIAESAPDGEFLGVVTVILEGAKPDRVRVRVTGWVAK